MIASHPCGAKWGGHRASHCGKCHETFSSLTAFDQHRRGLTCRAPDDSGLVPEDNKHGTTVWRLPGTYAPSEADTDDT